MVRKSICALVVLTAAIGVVTADEFMAQITRVDGSKITYQKYEKSKKVGDAVTVEVAADAKIAVAKRASGVKGLVAGDTIEGGLKNKLFPRDPKDRGVYAYITTSDDNKAVNQILVILNKKESQP